MLRMILMTLIAAAGLLLSATAYGQSLQIERSWTYVKGYQVQNGIVLPVMGTASDRVTMAVAPPARPVVVTRQERQALDSFFAQKETQTWLTSNAARVPVR